MKIFLTKHACERAKERLGINSKDLKNKALLSLTDGIDALADETLRPYVIKTAKANQNSGIYIYENIVFIFKEDSVVTVYPISWITYDGEFDKKVSTSTKVNNSNFRSKNK